MSVLSDLSLRDAITAMRLAVRPLSSDAIQPSSVDLRLGPDILIATPDGFRAHHLIDDGPYRLQQHAFVLGATLEWIEIAADLAGVLAGKSSRAREGIQIESAGLVDGGWRGKLTLEIVMLSPLPAWLMVGMQIAQLYIHTMTSEAKRPYGSDGVGRYQHSTGPVESRAVVGRPS